MFHIVAGSAKSENIESTIRNAIPLSQIKEVCSPEIFHRLERLYPSGHFHCWALSVANKYEKSFPLIRSGDLILLKPNGQKKGKRFFTWLGRIVYTTDRCPELGQLLWKSGKGWERLLFLDSIEEVKIPDYIISAKLGFENIDNFRYSYTPIKELSENIDDFIDFCRSQKFCSTETTQSRPEGETIIRKQRLPIDPALQRVCDHINSLKSIRDHSERDNEALVKEFLEYCGYLFTEDFKYRAGFIDIGIFKGNKCVAVIEVKKEWSAEKLLASAQKQAFSYALEHGARFVIITNSDNYFVYDRNRPGLSFGDYLLGEFQLTNIRNQAEIDTIHMLFKSNLLAS
jgi:hypothetical protein